MESWKRAVLAGSAGLGIVCLLRRNRTGTMIFGGVALTILASEYPEESAEIRSRLPAYVESGLGLLDVATRLGEHIAYVSEPRRSLERLSLLQA
jgi:hypothetical protein